MGNKSQDINYALISALYASKTNGLYSDVYFPIIKYTIVQLFNQRNGSDQTHYYTSQDVQEFIENTFRIQIPTIVIAKSLQKINGAKKKFVDLELMENGDSFKITRMWDSSEFEELAERELDFTNGLKEIESDYRNFSL